MPMVRFSGLENEFQETIRALIQAVKIWVSSVEGLGIVPEDVRPFYSPIVQENSGECVIFEVLELFTEGLDGKLRTDEMRKALCASIEAGFLQFIDAVPFQKRPSEIVIIIRMVDRDKGECAWRKIPQVLGCQYAQSVQKLRT